MLIKNVNKIVLKLGSSTVVDSKGVFKKKWVTSLIKDIKKYGKGKHFVIVSSGAIAPEDTMTKFLPLPYFFISLIRDVTHFLLKTPMLSTTVVDPSFKTILFAFLISIFN